MSNIGKIQRLERLVIARRNLRESLDYICRAYHEIEANSQENNKGFISTQVFIDKMLDRVSVMIEKIESEIYHE